MPRGEDSKFAGLEPISLSRPAGMLLKQQKRLIGSNLTSLLSFHNDLVTPLDRRESGRVDYATGNRCPNNDLITPIP